MFDTLTGMLHFGFVQRAIVAGIFIALSSASLGVFLVLRRFSLIGDGIAHVSFAAIACALVFHKAPLVFSIPFVVIASLLIQRLSEKSAFYGDAAIGLVSVFGIATGVLLASMARGFNVDILSYLFGNILAVSYSETIASIVLALVTICIVAACYNKLFMIAFDAEYARVIGVKVSGINTLLVVITACTVLLGIRVVGTLLVSGLIILPAVTALELGRSFRATIFLALLFAVASVIIGILISLVTNLPTGATIVYVSFAFFVSAYINRKFFR